MTDPSHETWVHGVSLHVRDAAACEVIPHGAGADVKGDFKKSAWVHFAVPTPVLAAGRKLGLRAAMVRFAAENARVLDIHVWDGDRRVATHDDLWLAGTMQVKKVPALVTQVRNGIAIAVRVGFWDPLTQAEIDAILMTAKSGEDYIKTSVIEQWKKWGLGVSGFVRFAGAGCEFGPAGVLQAELGTPGTTVIDTDLLPPIEALTGSVA